MQRRAGYRVTVSILSQPVGIRSVCLPLMDQAKSLGDHRITLSGRGINFQFGDLLARFRDDLDHLPVSQLVLLCVDRVHDKGACSLSFIPFRVPHMGV